MILTYIILILLKNVYINIFEWLFFNEIKDNDKRLTILNDSNVLKHIKSGRKYINAMKQYLY